MRLLDSKNQCQVKLGFRESDSCYKDRGHVGKCYISLGLEAEDIIQEILRISGYKVVKGTKHEDHDQKVDFWIKCQNSECSLISDHGYAPIQFTIDRQAADGLKGWEAMHNGTIIVCIAWNDLKKWRDASDEDMRKAMSQSISVEFMRIVKEVADKIVCLGHKLQTPCCNLSRFED